jgi:hypothetical protein
MHVDPGSTAASGFHSVDTFPTVPADRLATTSDSSHIVIGPNAVTPQGQEGTVCAPHARDMAAAFVGDRPAPSIAAKHMQRGSCLNCGADLDVNEAEEAQQRIKQLESQVELLTEKATAAGTLTLRSARSSCAPAD